MRIPAMLSACVAALLMAGCGGRMVPPHYYALETPPELSSPVRGQPIAATLAVTQFGAPAWLRQGRIVYRQSPEEIGFYEYRRWAVEPAETITTAMIRALRARQLFSLVKLYDGKDQQDYLMTGRLEKLEEVDYGGPVRVEAEISGELVNLRTGRTEWTGDASATVNLDKSDVNALVAEMDSAVQDCIHQLAASMDGQMSSKRPPAG